MQQVVVLLILLLAAQSSGVLVSLTFEQGMPAELETTGGWSIIDIEQRRVLHGEARQAELAYLPLGSGWTDYAVDARLRLTRGTVALGVRVPDTLCGGYGAAIAPADQLLNLFVFDAQCEWSALDVKRDYPFKLDQWQTVRLEVNGPQVTFFVGGKRVLMGQDTSYTAGFPMLILFPDSVVDVDYVRVTSRSSQVLTQIVLQDYASDPPHAAAELFDLAMVPTEGRLLFEEDYAWFQGEGNWFTPLARRAPHRDIAMAGELTFQANAASELEICTLMFRTRIDDAGSAEQYVQLAITSQGDALVVERAGASEEAVVREFAPLGLDLDSPHHLLLVAIDSRLTVFIDGRLVFHSITISDEPGTYGISLVSQHSDSRCEGRSLWVYQYDG